MKEFIAAPQGLADRLPAVLLPSYAPDLNPQEGIWALIKRGIGNLAATND
nr:transposase [Streptomyces inhibens]